MEGSQLAGTSDKTAVFFEDYAHDFDEIYRIQKMAGVSGWLNRRLRASMLLRYEKTFSALAPLSGKTILDVGCGSGRYVAKALSMGAEKIVALDLSPEMLTLTKRGVEGAGFSMERVELVQGDFMTFDSPSPYDCGIVMGVMDYIDRPAEFLAILADRVRQKAVLSFPVAESVWAPQRKVRYMLRRCPLFFYSRPVLQRLLDASPFEGFAIERIGRDYFVTAWHEDSRK